MPKELLRDSTPPRPYGRVRTEGGQITVLPRRRTFSNPRLDMADLRSVGNPQGMEIRTMDQIILITIGCTFAITLGLLLGLGYYLGRQTRRIDEIGFMVALLLDHLQVPGATCEDCEIETLDDLSQFLDVRRNDTLLNPNRFASTVAFPANWQSWDGEQE